MSTRSLILCSCLVTFTGCASSSRTTRAALDDATVVEREMDTLYLCGVEAASARDMSIDRSDPEARIFMTEWAADGDERWRMTFMVRVHPRFGPGADAFVTRDSWVGEGAPETAEAAPSADSADEGTGWVRVAGPLDDRLLASDVTAAVSECWSERSPLAR